MFARLFTAALFALTIAPWAHASPSPLPDQTQPQTIEVPVDLIQHAQLSILEPFDTTLGTLNAVHVNAFVEGHSVCTVENFTPSRCHYWLGQAPAVPQLQHNKAGLALKAHSGAQLLELVLDLPNADDSVAALNAKTTHQDTSAFTIDAAVITDPALLKLFKRGPGFSCDILREGQFTETDSCGLMHRTDQTSSGGVLEIVYEYTPALTLADLVGGAPTRRNVGALLPPAPFPGCGDSPYTRDFAAGMKGTLPVCSACKGGTPPPACVAACALARSIDIDALFATANHSWAANCTQFKADWAACDGNEICEKTAEIDYYNANTPVAVTFINGEAQLNADFCRCIAGCCPYQ